MMLTHGVAPESLLRSTLVSIPKYEGGNTYDSSNYRQISVSSVHGNIFNIIKKSNKFALQC